MNLSTFSFTLDVKDTVSRIVIPIKQADTGRKLQISLSDGHRPYEITSECMATLRAVKPDETALFNACTVQGNRIETEITAQMVARVGVFPCEITLYGADGRQLISPKFTLNVLEKIGSDTEIESTNEYTALVKTMSEAAALITEVETKLANGDFKGDPGEKGADGTMSFEDLTAEQKASLKGEKGDKGDPGAQGIQGEQGDPFTYEDFTQEQLENLVGPQGEAGDAPYIGENGNWWVGAVDTGVRANFESHLKDKTNPHGVTAGQVGATPGVESADHPGYYYRITDGVTEWLNPPMELGVEYRTTERYNGKPVYVASFDFGSLPSSGSKQQYLFLSNGGDIWGETIVDMNPSFCDNYGYTHSFVDGLTDVLCYLEPMDFAVNVTTSKDLSNINLKVTVKYTKE